MSIEFTANENGSVVESPNWWRFRPTQHFTDYFLDDVLVGHDASRRAELIDDDGHPMALGTQLGQEFVYLLGFRNDVWLSRDGVN